MVDAVRPTGAPNTLDVRLLGPVEAYANGRQLPLGHRKQRFVLALLALEVNQLVPVDRLVELMWPQSPPRTAMNAVQVCVSRLRSLLGAAVPVANSAPVAELARLGSGYVLRADPMVIDAHRFRALAERARGVDADSDRVKLLDDALALWVGPAMAGSAPADLCERLCRGLEESRLVAVEDRLAARLRLGNHREVLDELTDLVAAHPIRERLVGQLMRALYRCGRPVDALRVFRDVQGHLAEDQGLDPGAELRQIELAILRGDDSLDLVTARPPEAEALARPTLPGGPAALSPALLPAAVTGFAGRPGHLARLDATLADHERAGSAASITVISGTAGVGKTALALHWAHRVAHRFPDGQLYVNLRGFDRAGLMKPMEVIRGFLAALGVTAGGIPAQPQAQIDLYLSRLAGTRTLLVLDNAADVEQVRPLVPGAPGCLVVVTSRRELASLVAVEGAHAMALDVLPADEARDLLRRRLGAERLTAEPVAADELIELCARLPLALAIVAARAAMRPSFRLASLVTDIRAARGSLDVFSSGDRSVDVRTVFSWSYRTLSSGGAELFRLLALHPGPDITAPAMASLAGVSVTRTGRLLGQLTQAHLVEERTPGRYSFHDLLRSYAAELAETVDDPSRREAARHRLYDHYLHTAHAAAGLLDASRADIVSAAPHDAVAPEPLADHEEALAWLIAEYPVLLGVVRQAGASGFDAHAWQLACTLTEFFERRGLWQDWLAALSVALSGAERLDDQRALAYTHRGIGRANYWLGNHDVAQDHHQQALRHFTILGDRRGLARTWHSLGHSAELRGELKEALSHTQKGLELFRAAGDRPGVAKALNGVGWYHCLLGDYQEALRCCGEALALVQELGDKRVTANTWDSLGYAHHQAGDHRQAIDCYEQALALFREIGDRFHEADASIHLGDTYAAARDPESARLAWQRALTILEDLGHPDASRVREVLVTAGS